LHFCNFNVNVIDKEIIKLPCKILQLVAKKKRELSE
jgi:hypothetical protein